MFVVEGEEDIHLIGRPDSTRSICAHKIYYVYLWKSRAKAWANKSADFRQMASSNDLGSYRLTYL